MGFLAKYWPLLLLLLLVAGLLLFVNRQNANVQGNATPSFNPSLFPYASFSPSVSASGARDFVQQIPLGAGGKSVVLRQELGPDGVEKTFLGNYGLQQAGFVLLKVVPTSLAGEFEGNWRSENPDALTGENLSESVFKFKYLLASGGSTEFKLKSGKWGASLIYQNGLFSAEQELRLAALLEKLAGLNLSVDELQAFQTIANLILSDDSLSAEEKLSQLEAFVDAIEKIHELAVDADGNAISDSAKAGAIGKAGALLRSGGISALENGLDEIIKELIDTRACENLPKALNLTVVRCSLPAGTTVLNNSLPFYGGLVSNAFNNFSTLCNPSSVSLDFLPTTFDVGSLVVKFSDSDLGRIFDVRAPTDSSNGSMDVVMRQINFTPPWVTQNASLPSKRIDFANLTPSNITQSFVFDPFSPEGSKWLCDFFITNSLVFESKEHKLCFDEILKKGRSVMHAYDKLLTNVSLTLEPLSAKYGRGNDFLCFDPLVSFGGGSVCNSPAGTCAVMGKLLNFTYDGPAPPGDAVIENSGSTYVSSSYNLLSKKGFFEFYPVAEGNYSLKIYGKTVTFEVKKSIDDCLPELANISVSPNCTKYLLPGRLLNATVALFEFNNSQKCFNGVMTGSFGRVVPLPCETDVTACVKFYSLGKSRSFGGGMCDAYGWQCDFENIANMSVEEFRKVPHSCDHYLGTVAYDQYGTEDCDYFLRGVMNITGAKVDILFDRAVHSPTGGVSHFELICQWVGFLPRWMAP
ncbi:MAG: hypothetical protein V1811_02550 [Candidatus Micrarchaeota archaeon]